jgi:2-amino-4-hydroxy-6-hydroxymethyldihydropteridine diphosphokinase
VRVRSGLSTLEALKIPAKDSLRAVLGIGANLGDRLQAMREAVRRVGCVVTVQAVSHVYETAPVGNTEQPSFLNAAIAVDCLLSPLALLDALLAIERDLGRIRSEDVVRWGPRTIDLDVLWIDGLVLDDPRLVVPHPRLVERAFALVPLLEIAPGAVDPRTHARYVAPHDEGVKLTALTLT